jgi:hypothetical protein
MSVKSLRQAANNRLAANTAAVAGQTSDLARLRRAVEWVMSEAKAGDRSELPAITERITGIARELNERRRP